MGMMTQKEIDELVKALQNEYGTEYTRYLAKKRARVRNRTSLKKLQHVEI